MSSQPPETPGTPENPGQPERFADGAGRYSLTSRIATGGMGEVWRGTDTTLGRPVAVKLLKTEYADDATFRSRFETEARNAAVLHHPGIAGVYDFGEAPATDGSGIPRPYLVMELVDGQPLSALLRSGEPMEPEVVADLMAQTAEALAAAHAAGIVHRDVKPANLLITPERKVKVTDFGIARAADAVGITQTGQVLGTPQYLSPEQARGTTATPASDVYALGVVAFECLAGERPFDAGSPVATALAHLNQPVPDLPDSVPAPLAAVVQRALSKDPADRYPEGSAFAAALRDPLNDSPAGAGALGGPSTAATMVAGGAGLAAGAAAGAALGAGAAAADEPGTQVFGATPGDPTAGGTDTTGATDTAGSRKAERKRPWALIAVAAVLAIALLAVGAFALLSGGDDESDTGASAESTSASASASRTRTRSASPSEETSAAATVSVDADDYVGRDVQAVQSELEDLGLLVQLDQVDNDGSGTEDQVTSVDPTGTLEEGDSVTVQFYGPAPTTQAPTETETVTETPSESATPTETTSSAPASSQAATDSTSGAAASTSASTQTSTSGATVGAQDGGS
ncbi:serine/threonine protein kinase [Nocardioides bruguierae]|uniref:serine/threonine protein kinase n=1 Tax=Nocardioides bruguierae TaxID=2945102 RepID=UPI0027E13E7A|nr:serine/threonine protein kinase [Nocardioides bruguierae]